ncbi:50S ribosomal protein L30 [archaeon]|jgi:large subunit ribosomal protein L30|nr:50S ribosomal protein L30 [archaeon]MBT6697675.1 50S ribosomal protein L30 [archaeon]
MAEAKEQTEQSAKVVEPKAAEKASALVSGKVAIVLVRGLVKVRGEIKQTIWNLGLRRVNQCVVVEMNASIQGMLRKAKDYVTWGPLSDSDYNTLVEARGEEYHGRETDSKGKYKYNFVEVNGKKYKKVLRLNPPRKGFGRAGVKRPFISGGALGNRAEAMADLVKRMI